jgi:hypothetical protein
LEVKRTLACPCGSRSHRNRKWSDGDNINGRRESKIAPVVGQSHRFKLRLHDKVASRAAQHRSQRRPHLLLDPNATFVNSTSRARCLAQAQLHLPGDSPSKTHSNNSNSSLPHLDRHPRSEPAEEVRGHARGSSVDSTHCYTSSAFGQAQPANAFGQQPQQQTPGMFNAFGGAANASGTATTGTNGFGMHTQCSVSRTNSIT